MELDKFFLGNEGLYNYLNHLMDDFIMIEFWCEVNFDHINSGVEAYHKVDVEWVSVLFGKHQVETGMVKDAIEDLPLDMSIWQPEDRVDGCHVVRALCTIEFDSDDYKKWYWISFLHSETELKFTKAQIEQMERDAKKQEKENEDDLLDLLDFLK